jgi:hypothetical protein
MMIWALFLSYVLEAVKGLLLSVETNVLYLPLSLRNIVMILSYVTHWDNAEFDDRKGMSQLWYCLMMVLYCSRIAGGTGLVYIPAIPRSKISLLNWLSRSCIKLKSLKTDFHWNKTTNPRGPSLAINCVEIVVTKKAVAQSVCAFWAILSDKIRTNHFKTVGSHALNNQPWNHHANDNQLVAHHTHIVRAEEVTHSICWTKLFHAMSSGGVAKQAEHERVASTQSWVGVCASTGLNEYEHINKKLTQVTVRIRITWMRSDFILSLYPNFFKQGSYQQLDIIWDWRLTQSVIRCCCI